MKKDVFADVKGAIFDLDGTLLDSMGVWDKISRDFLTGRGIAAPDDIGAAVKNMSFTESAAYYIQRFLLPDSREQLIAIWNEMAFREYAERIELKAGAASFVRQLRQRGICLGVASATDRALTEAVLKRHGILDWFQAIVTVAYTGKGKNSPDFFRAAAQRIGVAPQECAVFEDCLHAVQGAKLAGMRVWGVYDPFSAHERQEIERFADGYIESFAELLL